MKLQKGSATMNISPLTNAQSGAEDRRSFAGRRAPAGTSFQDQLVRTYAGTQAKSSPVSAEHPGQTTKDTLLSALFDLKTSMLDRMKLSKEKTEEQQAWEKLMKYLDAWIKSLQDGNADIQKSAKAYADLQDALTKEKTGRNDLGSYILEQLTERLSNG